MSMSKTLFDHFRFFMKRFPLIALGIVVCFFWIPLIPRIINGTILDPMVDLYIMKFEYASIPIGFTLMYLIFIPIYYFHIVPELEKDRKKLSEDLARIYGNQRARAEDIWKRR